MNSRFVPKIEKPCPANWDEMKGDEKRRFCEHCQLHVHNLSAMTPQEQRRVLTEKSDHTCISYVTRPDSIPVSPQDWLNRNGFVYRLGRSLMVPAVALLSLLGVSCESVKTKDQRFVKGRVAQPSVEEVCDGKRTSGAPVMQPRPFWKRFLGIY